MAYVRTIGRLDVSCLDEKARARTCGYWYCVTSGSTPETAFRTRAEFLQWMDLYGLEIDGGEVPQEGERGYFRIKGQYRTALHLDRQAWEAVEGVRIMALDNGEFTEFRLTPDPDGTICANILNPNVRDRPRFDYRQAMARRDAGRAQAMLEPLEGAKPY